MSELKRGLEGDAADDFNPDLIEGQDFLSQSGARDKARHTPDDAADLILDDHGGAGGVKRLESFQAILAHTGQNHTRRTGAEDLRHRGAN